jgi:predicted molibdopterin-dependent oxidoreductase YjgC
MAARMIRASNDPVQPLSADRIGLTLDGTPHEGVRGQTIAGVLLAEGVLSWRRTSVGDSPRGVFCGIGVCFDCIVEVNGVRDIRACQRRAQDGDVVRTQHDELPEVTS